MKIAASHKYGCECEFENTSILRVVESISFSHSLAMEIFEIKFHLLQPEIILI